MELERKNNDETNMAGNEVEQKKHPLLELVQAIVIAFLIAFVIRTFIFQPFWVPTTSMVPTLKVDDRIIVNELFMRYGEIERGDIMVFRYPLDPDIIYVKRMIGLPGDTFEIQDDGIYINGEQLHEPYLKQDHSYEQLGPFVIPEGSYFGMGDNRQYSADSRYWGFIPEDNFIGKAIAIYWPLANAGQIK